MELSVLELDIFDAACVPAGFLLLICYHAQLYYRVWKFPTTTVMGMNRLGRRAWIDHVTKDPVKLCAASVQAMRNSLMASCILATASITVSTIIGAIISHSNQAISTGPSGGKPIASSSELFSVLACFLISFFCNLQTLKYGCYVSYMICTPLREDAPLGQSPGYVYSAFEKNHLFWSLGLRAFYFSVPMLMWLFGPIAMLMSSLCVVTALHFTDTLSTNLQKSMARLDSIQVK